MRKPAPFLKVPLLNYAAHFALSKPRHFGAAFDNSGSFCAVMVLALSYARCFGRGRIHCAKCTVLHCFGPSIGIAVRVE